MQTMKRAEGENNASRIGEALCGPDGPAEGQTCRSDNQSSDEHPETGRAIDFGRYRGRCAGTLDGKGLQAGYFEQPEAVQKAGVRSALSAMIDVAIERRLDGRA